MTNAQDVLGALVTGVLPEEWWDVNDDKCDCVYQRIGMWTNPYLAETLEVRMCCIWAELYKLFPDKVRVIPAFQNYNTGTWDTEPWEWNGDYDMPKSIWYRQLARKEGITVAEAREKYKDRDDERPKAVPQPPPSIRLSLSQMIALRALAAERAATEQKVGQILSEAGLDPGVSYHISEDGEVSLVE